MGTKAGGDPAIEVRDGVERVRTDPDRPPVAVRAPHLITGREKIVFALIALLGAVGWSMIAVVRGEHVNAVWFVFAAVGTYIIGFRFYARLIEYKVLKPRDERATPSEEFENGKDFLPTYRRVLFGHHFAAIAGAGPLVGPVLAAQMGCLPGTLWIVIRVVFASAVQDYMVLHLSIRRGGRSLGQMARDGLGRVGGTAAIAGGWIAEHRRSRTPSPSSRSRSPGCSSATGSRRRCSRCGCSSLPATTSRHT